MLTKMRLIKRVDRYILLEVIPPFLGGLLFFTFIFLLFQILRLLEFFVSHSVSPFMGLKIIFLLSISFVPVALPVAFLIATLISFGRLSADSELTALKGAGISLLRSTRPIFVLAIITAVLSFLINFEWVPQSKVSYKKIVTKIMNTKISNSIQEGAFTTDFFNLLIFADKVDHTTNTMTRLFLYDERDQKNPLTIISRSGKLFSSQKDSLLGFEGALQLSDGNIHKNNQSSESYDKINFKTYQLYLNIKEGGDSFKNNPTRLTLDQLTKKINNSKPKSKKQNKFLSELWRRLSLALSPIFFVFLGVGLGTVKTRSVRSGAALITFGVILTYWFFQTYLISIAISGQLPAWLALQLPNFLILIIGYISFKKASAW